MKKNIIFFSILFFLLTSGQNLYAMTTVKGWINSVVPGTFDVGDASGDKNGQEQEVFTKSKIQVLNQLRQRERELKKKEDIFQQKTKELKLLSQQIEQKLDQMRSLANNIESQRKARREMDEKDISKMVRYYETMSPDNTAVFFNKMDRQTATHLIMKMNPRKASAVMQLLEPKVAVDITERVTRFKENREELTAKK